MVAVISGLNQRCREGMRGGGFVSYLRLWEYVISEVMP